MNRLAVITTHPIQYCAPLFRRLAERRNVELKVFYGHRPDSSGAFDIGFGRNVEWDIPLLEGYEYAFVRNRSSDAGTHHFRGIAGPDLVSDVSSWRPSAVLVYGWKYQSHLNALRHFHGRIPVLFRGDSTLIDKPRGMKTLARRAVLSWIYRRVDIALYVGKHNRDYFRWCGLDEDRLMWAPHSIENNRFADDTGAVQREADAWRARLGIASHEKVVLFAGKLQTIKAPDLLLDCFLQRRRNDEHLLIVGSGELEIALRDRASLHRNVHFLGFQNQSRMPAIYRLADVYVHPSRAADTWGLAVNEAMASNRPVVVSDCVGCAPDLVIEGRSGMTFPASDSDALSSAIDKMLNDRARLAALGRGAAEVIKKWDIDAQADCIEAAVERSQGILPRH